LEFVGMTALKKFSP